VLDEEWPFYSVTDELLRSRVDVTPKAFHEGGNSRQAQQMSPSRSRSPTPHGTLTPHGTPTSYGTPTPYGTHGTPTLYGTGQ
jgi:hypothetical protein